VAEPGCCSRCSTGTATDRSKTAGARRRCAMRSTCAWRARGARATARSTSTWPPTRHSSWPSTIAGGCGLTWISTGQLGQARRRLRATARTLHDHLAQGGLVLGLEPSCTAVFRGDATELLPEDRDLARLRDQTVTLAEVLVDHTDGWQPGPVTTRTALAQVHCHQHAISGGTGTPSCWTVPESTWSGCPPAVVAWRATSGSPPAMGRSAATSGSRSCCPGCARGTRTPPYSRTGSPAAPRSRSKPTAPTRSTWPSCSPRGSPRANEGRDVLSRGSPGRPGRRRRPAASRHSHPREHGGPRAGPPSRCAPTAPAVTTS
jgi:hypothetical protein